MEMLRGWWLHYILIFLVLYFKQEFCQCSGFCLNQLNTYDWGLRGCCLAHDFRTICKQKWWHLWDPNHPWETSAPILISLKPHCFTDLFLFPQKDSTSQSSGMFDDFSCTLDYSFLSFRLYAHVQLTLTVLFFLYHLLFVEAENARHDLLKFFDVQLAVAILIHIFHDMLHDVRVDILSAEKLIFYFVDGDWVSTILIDNPETFFYVFWREQVLLVDGRDEPFLHFNCARLVWVELAENDLDTLLCRLLIVHLQVSLKEISPIYHLLVLFVKILKQFLQSIYFRRIAKFFDHESYDGLLKLDHGLVSLQVYQCISLLLTRSHRFLITLLYPLVFQCILCVWPLFRITSQETLN